MPHTVMIPLSSDAECEPAASSASAHHVHAVDVTAPALSGACAPPPQDSDLIVAAVALVSSSVALHELRVSGVCTRVCRGVRDRRCAAR